MSEQENFHRPEKPLEKTREMDNDTRISKKAEMKRKFNRNQKYISPWDIQLISLTALLISNGNLFFFQNLSFAVGKYILHSFASLFWFSPLKNIQLKVGNIFVFIGKMLRALVRQSITGSSLNAKVAII